MRVKPIYIAIILLMVLSCKTKYKLVKQKTVDTTLDIVKIDNLNVVKIDSTKKVTKTDSNINKKDVLELTFDFDNNKLSGETSLFKSDTGENNLINSLINKALRNARSLKIKVEKSLDERVSKEETTQNNIKETQSLSSKTTIAAETKVKDQTTEKKKDTKPNFNTILLFCFIGLGLLLIIKLVWPLIKGKLFLKS